MKPKAKPKDRWVGVRFGADDYAALKVRAQAVGIGMGTWLRLQTLPLLREGR